MYNKPMLSLDQVQRAMAAMLEKATQQPNQPVAIAIVDDGGSLVSAGVVHRCRAIPAAYGHPQGVHRGVVGPGTRSPTA